METILQDLRYGLRLLRKAPGFTAVAVLTLALGIGATTAIFSVVYEVLLRPLAYEKPDQIVRLWEVNASGHRVNFADPNFSDFRAQNHSLQGLAEYAAWPESVSGGSAPTRTMVATVSRDFFPLMRVVPVHGRSFAPDDARLGAAPTALVSFDYWREYLHGTSELSTIKLLMENQVVSVVGVLPVGFHFPDDSAIWVPRELREPLPSRTAHNWHVIGRLRDGTALGATYQASFWFGAVALTGYTPSMAADILGSDGLTLLATQNYSIAGNDGVQYQLEQLTFVADGLFSTIRFTDTSSVNSDPADGLLDTVSVAQVTAAVPEPATWAMMILGFAGVGFMAYRQKNSMASCSSYTMLRGCP